MLCCTQSRHCERSEAIPAIIQLNFYSIIEIASLRL